MSFNMYYLELFRLGILNEIKWTVSTGEHEPYYITYYTY